MSLSGTYLAPSVPARPGPRHGADDKPGLHNLLYMSSTGEDGRDVQIRLMQQVRPHWRDLAIALKFPQHEIAIMEKKDDPVYYLLSEWLRGANQVNDPRPVTWGTLIEALQHANVQEEATVLKNHFIVTIPNVAAGLMMQQHGPITVTVNPDVPKSLLSLMKAYADMLVVLKMTKLSEEEFTELTLFLSCYCKLDEDLICKCSTFSHVIRFLQQELKIWIFNIDTLIAIKEKFNSDKATSSIEQYTLHLTKFLSSTSVIEFKDALEVHVNDPSSAFQSIILKLDKVRTKDTLKHLETLVYDIFGFRGRALIFIKIGIGCVCVTWLVPTSLVSTMRAIAEQHSQKYLSNLGVLELVIGSLRVVPNEARFTVGDIYSKDEETEGKLKAVRKEKSDYKEKCEQQELEAKEVEGRTLKKFEYLEGEKKALVLQEESKDTNKAGFSAANVIDITSDESASHADIKEQQPLYTSGDSYQRIVGKDKGDKLENKCCSSAHIAKISEHIENWQELGPYFGITEAEEQEILNNHAHQYKVQKRKMVWKWVGKQGDRATYRELKRVFEEAGESLLVSRIDDLLQDAYSQTPHNIVNSFREYLKDCYCGSPATYQGQKDWSPQLSESPFVKPELVLKPQLVAGSKQPSNQQEIEIRDLHELGKKVMLEGTAGSGKTSLTRHICQQWAEGELFHDINLLIHLTLADPTLWSAKSLEDIIPYPSAEMRKTVADHIVEQGGKRCCFILDGWEDLPERLSFIHKVLEGKQPGVALPHCLFIVTSRPVATAFLQTLVSATVEITGFSHESVDTYATQYLTQVGRDPTVFITALNSNHHARGLCSLPINAAILLHLFLTIQTGLPSTQTELFKCFILNLLLRHLIAKMGHKCRSLRKFSDLPLNEKYAFNNLCLIAHYSTFSSKASSQSNQLLSSDDLQKAGLHDIEDTLGLMKVHQQLTWCGYDPHYGFLHSSVQDFLCAVRMSQLSSEEQVRDFTHIVNANPTSLVLYFYAGLTKLENKSVCQLLCKLGREPPGPDGIYQVSAPHRLFLTYLHCLYEANMTSVLVKPKEKKSSKSPYVVVISYKFYRLTIHDLNVISYYILSITRISHPTRTVLSLLNCFIDDHGIETLVANIIEQAQSYHSHQSTFSGSFKLDISSYYECTYTRRGVKALANLITLNNVPLVELWVQCGDFSSLKTMIEAFSSPTAVNCRGLVVADSGLTSRHVYHLILLLAQARYLQHLDISLNPGLHEAVPLLLSAARNLKSISFSQIPIDDQELLEMAQVLQSNASLTNLCIESEFFMGYSFKSLTKFVEIVTAPESKSQLESLLFGGYRESEKTVSLSNQLTDMAASRGHVLVVQPIWLNTK